MKKLVRSLAVFLLLLFVASASYAHTPKWIKVFYITDNQTLFIKVKHEVKDTDNHYIGKIEIEVNGETSKTITSKNQLTPVFENQKLKLDDVKSGDEITVTAYCNKHGKVKKSITIPEN